MAIFQNNNDKGNCVSSGEHDFWFAEPGRFDFILGEKGNDTILAGDMNDTIYGGQGDDLIHGGRGYDLLFGDLGDDMIHGDRENDTIHGGEGENYLYGGEGYDLFVISNNSKNILPDFDSTMDVLQFSSAAVHQSLGEDGLMIYGNSWSVHLPTVDFYLL